MVMLVIMIVGAAALLVSSLNSSSIKNARDKTTANALAQAKEALIGRALTDDNRPGSLPCPDTNDDGSAEVLAGDECPSYTGRLPWRTLGLPDLRDGTGERLWYALSQKFHDDNSIHINSETQGTLSIGGTNAASSVIAIVFSPGPALNSASRSPSITATCASLKNSPSVAQSLCATNYLEGSNAALNVSAVPATPNLNYQSANSSSTFNDQMILITHRELMPLVEKRIAREVKGCLDGYAALPTNANHYPWAAPVNDTTNYASTSNTLFGRVPKSNTYSAVVQQLLDELAALQLALNNYSANPSSTTVITALQTAGQTLKTFALAQTPATAAPLDQASLNQAANAGDYALAPHTPSPNATPDTQFVNSLQSQIDQAYSFFASLQHGNVTPGWALSSCTILPSAYWNDWKNLVFYQIADGYKPGGSGSCGSSCLTINGSGNTVGYNGTYHAAVIVAGEMLPSEPSRTPASITNYLEGVQAGRTNPPSSTIFESYKAFDSNYSTVNDLVLCLDGGITCK